MSLILDALKKLDREKNLGREGGMDIAAGILGSDPGLMPPRGKRALILCGLLLAAAVAGAGTYFVFSGSGASLQRQAATTVAAVPAPAPALVPAPAASPKTNQAAAMPDEDRENKQTGMKKDPPAAGEKRGEALSRGAGISAQADAPDQAATPLKISVIIWDDEPANRRAVVNGTLVGESDRIEDMKVVQIHPTRIKLSRKGRSFEASIN